MIATLHDPATVKVKNVVSPANSRNSMGYQEDRLILSPLRQVLHHAVFSFRIQRSGWFVENQDWCIAHHCPSDGQALLLTRGELTAAIGED